MKAAILASRQLNAEPHYRALLAALTELPGLTELHHGGEGAAAELTQRAGAALNLPTTAHKPDWAKHGKAAGPIRGKELIAAGDVVVALWDGRSKGTENELKEARRQGKRPKVIFCD